MSTTNIPAGSNRMALVSNQAAAASVSARARSGNRKCPDCGLSSVARVQEALTAPLLPTGCCRISCKKCSYTEVVKTREWEARR